MGLSRATTVSSNYRANLILKKHFIGLLVHLHIYTMGPTSSYQNIKKERKERRERKKELFQRRKQVERGGIPVFEKVLKKVGGHRTSPLLI